MRPATRSSDSTNLGPAAENRFIIVSSHLTIHRESPCGINSHSCLQRAGMDRRQAPLGDRADALMAPRSNARHWPKVRLGCGPHYRSGKPRSYGRQKRGFRPHRGDYIEWLGADDLLAGDKITTQMQRLKHVRSRRTLLSLARATDIITRGSFPLSCGVICSQLNDCCAGRMERTSTCNQPVAS